LFTCFNPCNLLQPSFSSFKPCIPASIL
jgi:hypothetical protein